MGDTPRAPASGSDAAAPSPAPQAGAACDAYGDLSHVAAAQSQQRLVSVIGTYMARVQRARHHGVMHRLTQQTRGLLTDKALALVLRHLDQLRRENDSLRLQVKQLHQRRRVDAKQRQVLLHNLGALLRTAKAELARLHRIDTI